MAKVKSFTVQTETKRTNKLPDGSFDSIQVGGQITVELDEGDEGSLDMLVRAAVDWNRGLRKSVMLPYLKREASAAADVFLGLPPEALALMGVDSPEEVKEKVSVHLDTYDGDTESDMDVSEAPVPASTKKGAK